MWKILKQWVYREQISTDSLDVLSTLVQLAVLSVMPIGSKLSLHDQRLTIQEPSQLQWIQRTFYGDEGKKIVCLKTPLQTVHHYLSDRKRPKNNHILKITEKAEKGISKLIQTYGDSQRIVADALEGYKGYLKINKSSIETWNSSIEHVPFSTVWTQSELEIIDSLLDNFELHQNSHGYFESIQLLLKDIHKRIWNN